MPDDVTPPPDVLRRGCYVPRGRRGAQGDAAARVETKARTTITRIVHPCTRCVIGAAVTVAGGGPSASGGAGTKPRIRSAAASTSRRLTLLGRPSTIEPSRADLRDALARDDLEAVLNADLGDASPGVDAGAPDVDDPQVVVGELEARTPKDGPRDERDAEVRRVGPSLACPVPGVSGARGSRP